MTFNYFARSAAWPCNQNLHTTLKDRLFMELFTLSSRSYLVAWIIATHCSIMVCPTTLSEEFSPSRTPLLGSHCRSRTTRSYLAGFAAVALASCPETCWLQTGMFWSGHAPPYLANDTLLVFEGPQRSSTLFHRQIVYRSTHTQHIRRQELRCRRTTCLEQSSGPLARRGHYIQQFQAWTLIAFLRATACYSAYMLSPVRPSVKRVDHTKTVEVRIMKFSPYGSPIPLVFVGWVSSRNSN